MLVNKNFFFLAIPVALLTLLGSLAYQTANAVPAEPEAVSSAILWENGKALTDSSSAPQSALQPAIAAAPDGKTVLVAFLHETTGGKTNPYYVRSTNNGESWSNPAQIYTDNTTDARFVNITTDSSSNGHAVWVEDNLALWYGKQSQWAGNTSSAIHTISATPGNLIESPQIVSNGSNLHVAWSQKASFDGNIYYMSSSNGGNNWGSATSIGSDNGADSISPSLAAADDGSLHIVWEAIISSAPVTLSEIYYAQSNNNGVTWTTPITISQKVSPATRVFAQPTIIAEGNSLYVAFENHPAASQQKPYFASCASNCANINNWNGNEASPQVYSVHGSDPTFLKAQPVVIGGCAMTLFSGITGGSTEKIWKNSSCNNWNSATSVSGVDAVLGNNLRAIKLSATTHNNWWVYFAFELKDGASGRSDIYFVRNIPALYLPVIIKQ